MVLTETTPTERAAILTYWLVSGRPVTTADAADQLDITQRTAQRLLNTIARTVPIIRDDNTGAWIILESESQQISPY
jgi:predicted DNA-binding transcriptional regulator YafY